MNKVVAGAPLRNHLNDIRNYQFDKRIFYREDNQIFFAKKCLLTEGPNDKYGMPVLAEKLSKSMQDLTVISCNGKNKIRHYKLLCDAFGIPAFVVFDKDENDKDKENILLDQMCGEDKFGFSSSFENVMSTALGISKSKILEKIDTVEVHQIPDEVRQCISQVDLWSSKLDANQSEPESAAA